MSITIKKVTTDSRDLRLLVAELDRFFIEEWGSEVAQGYQKHHYLAGMSMAVICYDENQAVGCGCWKLLEDSVPEIKRMYVKKEYRGQKIATKILSTLEMDVVKQGYSRVILETGAEMTAAIRFYETSGYQIVPNYGEFIGDERCVCLEKKLDSNRT
ncbi:GNAT family N-acetyltransferase [Enterococcus sp. LJL99]